MPINKRTAFEKEICCRAFTRLGPDREKAIMTKGFDKIGELNQIPGRAISWTICQLYECNYVLVL